MPVMSPCTVAIYSNVQLLLGSATPSIDSYALVEHGKMQVLELNQRAGTALMPKIHILDLKVAQKKHGISLQLIQDIKKRLEKKEQVLIFFKPPWLCPRPALWQLWLAGAMSAL